MSTIRYHFRSLKYHAKKVLQPSRPKYTRRKSGLYPPYLELISLTHIRLINKVPDQPRVEPKPIQVFKKVARLSAKSLCFLFLQAKYLIPAEAEAVECWMV